MAEPMTEGKLKKDYSKLVSEFLTEYQAAPIKAYGTNPLTGAYNQSKKNVLDNFKQNNAMFKAIAKVNNIKLELVSTDGMNPPSGDEIELQ